MGADLIIAIIPAPVFTDGEIVTDFDQIRTQVENRIRHTTDAKQRHGLLEELYPGDPDSLTKPDDVLARWMDIHEQVVNDYGYRDTTSFQCLHGTTYWITGGMSWGDDPTEAYQPFNAVSWLTIFDIPFEKEGVNEEERQ